MLAVHRHVIFSGALPPLRPPGSILTGGFTPADVTVTSIVLNGRTVNKAIETTANAVPQSSRDETFTMNAGQRYTFQVYARRYVGARDFEFLIYSSDFGGLANVNLSLATGQPLITPNASGTFGSPIFSSKKYASGWFDFSLSFTGAATALCHFYINITPENSVAMNTAYTGDGLSGIAWFGADFR